MSAPTVPTWLALLWLDGQIERWVRFGAVAEERIVDRRTRLVEFRLGAVFVLVRWRAGGHETVDSQISILRAVSRGEALTTHPSILPGAEILLRSSGWARVLLPSVSPEHWRTIGAHIGVCLPPSLYDRAWHRARRLRRSVGL
jgi:hypothetical protein